MIFADFIDQILSEQKPIEDAELTALAEDAIAEAKSAATNEPGLLVLSFLAFAVRFKAHDIQIECKDRQLTLRLLVKYLPQDFWSSPELLEWWWMLLSEATTNAWLACNNQGKMKLLGWDKGKVFRNQADCPVEGVVLEFQAVLKRLATPVFNAMADKKVVDQIQAQMNERGRLYPLPVYINGVSASSPLDIKIRQVSSFSSYDLVSETQQQLGFGVAHPWAHGCRYWLTPDGGIVDLHSKGASDINANSGNICHIPALGKELAFERRLNIMRKSGQDCIELSPVRNVWGKTSFLPGMERYLMDLRPLIFGETPVVKLMTRPLRVSQLLIQTEQTLEASCIVPIRDGIALDCVFENSKPAGVWAYAIPPAHLETTLNGRRLVSCPELAEWAASIVNEARFRQKPLSE